jgi:SAM-dependent methyltransferase
MGWFHDLPQAVAALETLPESFRTGVGRNFDSRGRDAAVAMERSFEPWNRAHLLPEVLPALDDVPAKLTAGGRAADVGCGAGGAVLLLAGAFPASHVAGYDISEHALARATERLGESGLGNASFHDARTDPLPADGSLDFVTTFDCIHDMTDPQGMMEVIRASLGDDGTWLLVDIKALDTFADNAARNPMASMMYGISVISCMSSGLSEPGGAGLGTLGLPPARARAMAEAAGFTRFRTLPVDHPVNAFYEVRP